MSNNYTEIQDQESDAQPPPRSSTSSPFVRNRQLNNNNAMFHSSLVDLYPPPTTSETQDPKSSSINLPKLQDLYKPNESAIGDTTADDLVGLIDSTSIPRSTNNRTPTLVYKSPRSLRSQFCKNLARNMILLTIGAISLTLTIIAWNVSYSKGPLPKPPISNTPINKDKDTPHEPTLLPVGLEDVFQGTFHAGVSTISWYPYTTSEVEDGEHYEIEPQKIIRTHIKTGKRTTLVDTSDMKVPGTSSPIFMQERTTKMSPDGKFVLVETKKEKHWRHSFLAEYIVININQHKVNVIGSKIQAIKWAPKGHALSYVKGNNVYVITNDHIELQLTYDGSDSIMNGVPDWVYEEEVLFTNDAMYWSTDGMNLSWIRFNDTSVPVYSYPYYFNPQANRDSPYPVHIPIRYPKPGYLNPLVSLFVASIEQAKTNMPTQTNQLIPIKITNPFIKGGGKIPGDADANVNSIIIADVVWVGESVLFKIMNRIQNKMATFIVDTSKVSNEHPASFEPEQVRMLERNDGWIENHHQIVPVTLSKDKGKVGYLDLVIEDDNIQLAYFPTVRDKNPVILTRGEYEVVTIAKVDSELQVAYVLTTQEHPSLRTLVSVPITLKQQNGPITLQKVNPNLDPGYYTVSFSAFGKYYWASYEGPGVPWQSVFSVADSKFRVELEKNTSLKEHIAKYAMAKPEYISIPTDSDKVTLNAAIYYPPGFKQSEKYPVLMRVYGGPNSQTAHQKYSVDIHTYLASQHKIICVMVDGRGTGFRGREFRVSVYRHLGEYEAIDQISAAKWLKQKPFVHPDKVAIWGWSYGGYVSGKVAALNTDKVFKAAISVAPVTDWRFYDSVYTERYMSIPSDNADGYRQSSILKMDGFRKTRYLLIHGTGDDNVHVQQSISLIRKLQISGVHSYRVQVFPDSDHSMNFANGYRECYGLLDRFLRHIFFNDPEFEVLDDKKRKLRLR